MGDDSKRVDDTVWQLDRDSRPVDIRGQLDMAEDRYKDPSPLGEGGMGEISLRRDRRIGRHVAYKIVRRELATPAARRAFLTEARVQAQLEHPAIVPVYDIGIDDDGVEYFTMRAIAGITLAQVIDRLRAGDVAVAQTFTRLKLLDAFRQVCRAIDYAHSKGVIHRDLKPANIILGEFGEVYVLDWGLALIAGGDVDASHTHSGPILGTPGYVAPELLATKGVVAAAADIYALGAILFELLALERQHDGRTSAERIQSTMAGARTAGRAPERDIPPELEQVCLRATALAPTHRFATVRELHDAIERFLEGDRDLALRRELAARHASTANDEARAALAGGPGSEARRRRAMQELARALALDPDDRDARQTLFRLIAEPPAEPPAEVLAEIDAAEDSEGKFAARLGGVGYASFIGVALLAVLSGLRSVTWLVVVMAGVVIAAAWCFKLARRFQAWEGLAVFCIASATIVVCTGFYGPLVIVPALAAGNTTAFTFATVRRYRKLMLVIGGLIMIVPPLVEWSGVLGHSYVFGEGVIRILPHFVDFPETVVRIALVLVNVATLAIPTFVLWRIADTKDDLRRKLVVQTWQMKQLIAS